MRYNYILPEIPPSNNKFIGRNVRWDYQKEKKCWADMVAAYCRPRPPKPLGRAVVTLRYHFKNRIRRDPDNYSGKMILDGLTRCGIIADDSFFCIKLQLEAVYDKDGGYTEIIVEEVK